jgi:pimeloyl-ACP methyl ester carboxylesterase
MTRRSMILVPLAAFSLAACASAPRDTASVSGPEFSSDRISVVTRGTGPNIILVHGLAAHRDVWRSIAETLDDRYRLHLVQVNGFAGAEPGANADGPVVAPVAEELVRYIREAGLSRPAVIGHSMGGTIAMIMAARHPQSVGRVMVVDMMPFMGAMFGANTAEAARPAADQMRSQMLAAQPGTGMLNEMVATMTRSVTMRTVLQQYARASHPSTLANAFHELIVSDLRPELSRITAPLTIVYVIPQNVPIPADQFESSLRLSYANAPSARFVRIQDSYHYIQVDQPLRLVAEVDAFMRR